MADSQSSLGEELQPDQVSQSRDQTVPEFQEVGNCVAACRSEFQSGPESLTEQMQGLTTGKQCGDLVHAAARDCQATHSFEICMVTNPPENHLCGHALINLIQQFFNHAASNFGHHHFDGGATFEAYLGCS